MSIAFLFPGQGSHRAGMLHRLPDTAASAGVLAEAETALRLAAERPGTAERDGLLEVVGVAELDTGATLEESRAARDTAVLVAGVAGARALVEDEDVRPGALAGRDVGGYAAAVLAGVLTFEEAVDTVRRRAVLLDGDEPRTTVAVRLAQRLATVVRRPQEYAYVSGSRNLPVTGDTQAVFDDLAHSAAHPGDWEQILDCLLRNGADRLVELPPGGALVELAAKQAPSVVSTSVETDGIARAARRVRGEEE
ncbi:acyltransferase domain-containing protein [Streptomyces xiaopingdaonensis]|uniref:acyltransferase domain-containing protein n=1 Tax=Streptomyces xiaopingdaonensis TaxID=1565415 RepID=UPI00035F2822|nr:acyltransferase domain-containing protein [Streptomyces xiaopingdaonensis]